MIDRYSIFIFLLISYFAISCQNNSSKQKSPSATSELNKKKPVGRIEFTKEIHNFGTLKEGEIVVFSFQFINSGGSSFRLAKVEPTCGCITVQFNKEEIPSQAKSAVDVIFNTSGEWGNQIKTVEIITSDGEAKTLTIDLNNLK
jgi:VanZ family protein